MRQIFIRVHNAVCRSSYILARNICTCEDDKNTMLLYVIKIHGNAYQAFCGLLGACY